MMQKNPVKKFAVALSVLALLAVGSLLAQAVQSNRNYERSLAHIRFLAAHLDDMHGQVLRLSEERLANEKKHERLDLLEYKNATFQKKFPEFSHIVDVAYRKAKRYGFNPNLVLSVMQVESAFNPLAVSSAGAYGLMQKDGTGTITIEIRKGDEEFLNISIIDDGIGREKAAELKSKSATHTSHGLKVTSQRIDMMNKLNSTGAQVRIIDLQDEKGNATGTKVELVIPF